MPKAPKPQNEQERLEELNAFEVLDTEAEELFDDITVLAAELIGTPIALISFVDEERQWFKSTVGLDALETHRDASFCAYAVSQHSTFVVENATEDSRVFDNPLVTGEPHIRAYAGTPLITKRGFALGTLCVISKEPRTFSEKEMSLLYRLGRQVVSLLDARMKNRLLLQEKEKAEKADRAKDNFLSTMSHELRTPLNSIIGFTKLLRMKLASQLSERDLDALDTVTRNGNLLLELINNILDLSKIEAGKVILSPGEFDLNSVAEGVLATLQPLADEKQLSMRIESHERISITADCTRITQAISNLVSNAVKYTDEGSVVVRIEKNEKEIVIAVQDTGQGISEHEQLYLFQRFTQLSKDEAKRRGGTGLGLIITRELIELHGGTVSVDSTMGKGSTFTLRIPQQFHSFVHSEKSEAVATSRKQDQAHGVNVLCIDDDPDALNFLKYSLEEDGFNTLLASGYDSAFSLLQKQTPEVILLDLAMSDKDGYAVLDELAKNEMFKDIPVIVVSAIADMMLPVKHAPISVLQKPVDPKKLRTHVQTAIGSKIKTVLLVEDDDQVAELLIRQLSEVNFRVIHAHNGCEALEQLQGNTAFGAMILDLTMPEMDGFTLLDTMEQDHHCVDLPVIVLTSRTLTEKEHDFLKKSTRAILSKGKGNTKKLLQVLLREAHRER